MAYAAFSVPTDLTVTTPEGAPVPVGRLVTSRLLVVQLVRYYGCLPCQDWLMQLDQLAPSLAEHGITAAAVGGSADYQAQWLRDEQGVRIPLYLDSNHRFRTAVGLEERLGLKLMDPRGAAAYLRSMKKGLRPQHVTRDTVQAPGVVVLDRHHNVCWQFRGQRIGDYPAMPELEKVVLQLAMTT
ncbi:MAG: AhpC/TSA family protein [Nocardioides sp.]